MSTLTKQTHTPGALRAAKRIMLEFRNDPDSPMAYRVAEIISRGTGDLGMLEALEEIAKRDPIGYPCGRDCNCIGCVARAGIKAQQE